MAYAARTLLVSGLLISCQAGFSHPAGAHEWVVGTDGEINAALRDAEPGDTISVRPGLYEGGLYRVGLTGVTIRRCPDSTGEAVFRGKQNGLHLVDAVDVMIEGLTFERQTVNGVNIDDGGSFVTPSRNVTIRDVTVRDIDPDGNHDGIKLSGVVGFLVDRVRVFDWGERGSAIDPVGVHQGIIQNSHFRRASTVDNGSGVRPKGGSTDIVIRGNLFEHAPGAGRPVQAGGSVGAAARFLAGESGYAARDVAAYGNRIVGGSSAMSWVNTNGGVFHHNDIRQPAEWALRILNENPGDEIVDTQNGVFISNAVEHSSTWKKALNAGAETMPETFQFTGNRWLNVDAPTPGGSMPDLPTPEEDGLYGVAAPFAADEPMRWDFDWGEWIVPLDVAGFELEIEDAENLLLATPGSNATFEPLADDPLSGDWSFEPSEETIITGAFDPLVLVRADSCAICVPMPGDYDRSGEVDSDDYQLWVEQYGFIGQALADGNGDGSVDAADFTLWRDASSSVPGAASVPEGGAGAVTLLTALALSLVRRGRGSAEAFSQ
ncbi:hypothetical protein Mal64_11370 [Pseudobythopirellula maris]|uniref:Probable pectate lyase C n=1 Tax=Pseudobythopirellula maris TaxID=2527991 RepID=A0A5C5ZU02_9BACT|nr:right-handed parallel beta-helix repeat-containing protein [Pseudobythopirellula maris]TWT90740.1 hypothetical protein Mal64_11370 [Pseudobythopirellula maris]